MSGNTQRTTFRPPWVKDGPNQVPSSTVPWRTKDKNATVSDQSNAVSTLYYYFSYLYSVRYMNYKFLSTVHYK